MRRLITPVVTGFVVVLLAGCGADSPSTDGSGSPVPTGSDPSPSPTDTVTLAATTDICAAFDAAAQSSLGVTAPTSSPIPSSDPICVYPGDRAAGRGPIAVQVQPDMTLDQWTLGQTNVIPLEVAGLPAASAQFEGLGCDLGVEFGGGVLSLNRSGTADDCSDLVPAAEFAVAGIRAGG